MFAVLEHMINFRVVKRMLIDTPWRLIKTCFRVVRHFFVDPRVAFRVSLATLLLTIFFICIDIKYSVYVCLVFLITATLLSCYSVRKNVEFYLYYVWVLITGEVVLYAKSGFKLPIGETTFVFFIVFALLLIVIQHVCSSYKLTGATEEEELDNNLFKEREQDLDRLERYFADFNVLGLNSFWGNGKTYLYEMFKKRNENSYYFVSISIMTLQLDSVEKFLICEIVKILEQNKILSSASKKFEAFIKGDFLHGIGRFFTSNSSYTEAFQTLIAGMNKLDRPLFITFEDIDRATDCAIVNKIFAMCEMLNRWTSHIRILFQYDKLAMRRLFKGEPESYFEKYIPYVIDLTPINFTRCLNVLIKKGRVDGSLSMINEKDFQNVTSEAHIGQWLSNAGITGIGRVMSLEPKWYSIRSIDLFVREVNALIAEDASYDKNVVVLLQFAKHFISADLFNINISEGFARNAIFTLDNSPCNIQKIIARLKEAEDDDKRVKMFDEIFASDSTNLYYLLLMNKLGYKLSKIIETPSVKDFKERAVNILNEPLSNLRDRDANEKLDRLVRRIYSRGRSSRTNMENAVKELEKVLDLDGAQRDVAFKEFLDKSYHSDFEMVDNSTIFLLGISTFVSIFQGFSLYERDGNYWLKLLNFYFAHCNITEITSETIQCLNYCALDCREVLFAVIKRFNGLAIKGNLNTTKSYAFFLRKYIQKVIDVSGIYVHMWEYLMSIGTLDVHAQFNDIADEIKSELGKLSKHSDFNIIKEDCAMMSSFIDKNRRLIQSKQVLKEYDHDISVQITTMDPVRSIEDYIMKENLNGEALYDFLANNYRDGSLKATETQRLLKKFANAKEVHHKESC